MLVGGSPLSWNGNRIEWAFSFLVSMWLWTSFHFKGRICTITRPTTKNDRLDGVGSQTMEDEEGR